MIRLLVLPARFPLLLSSVLAGGLDDLAEMTDATSRRTSSHDRTVAKDGLLWLHLSGDWTAVLISIGVTTAVVITVFKVIEYRVKKSVMGKMTKTDEDDIAPPAAGPLDEARRRQRIDQLLAAAGLPALAQVEPYFPEEDAFALLS